MDEVGGGDDDERALAHAEREDGAVEAAEVADDVDEGASLEEDLEEVADDGPAAGPGREGGGGGGGGAVAPPESGEEEEGEDGEEVYDIHFMVFESLMMKEGGLDIRVLGLIYR